MCVALGVRVRAPTAAPPQTQLAKLGKLRDRLESAFVGEDRCTRPFGTAAP